MTRVAIIPARANSKGLPGKNLKKVAGLSLVARAIEAARASGQFNRIVVTTDGEAIAAEAFACGAEVVRRPDAIAGDSARTIDAVEHALKSIGVAGGICVLLQPTSPLRSAADITSAITIFERVGYGCTVAVCECEHHPYKTFTIDEGAKINPMHSLSDLGSPRQELPRFFRPNGAIYINTIEDLLKRREFFIEPVSIYQMSAKSSVDVDDEHDLVLAEQLLGFVA